MTEEQEYTTQTVQAMLRADTAAQIRNGLRDLQRSKRLPSALKDPGFVAVVQRLAVFAQASNSEAERIMAVVVLARIRSALRLRGGTVVQTLRAALTVEPPPLTFVADPDDRLAVASALTEIGADWLSSYLAGSIVAEEAAEKTREELAAALLRSVPLAHGARALAKAFKNGGQEGSGTARKLRRTLMALRKRLPTIENEAGPDLGAALRGLFESGFESAAMTERTQLEGLAEEILGFLHDVLRAHPNELTDPEVYAAVAVPKSWFGTGLWGNWIKSSATTRAVLRDLSNGILLLGKQGITSDALRERFTELAGPEVGRKMLRQLGETHPELPGSVRQWLERGVRPQREPDPHGFEQSDLAQADRQLARAVLSAERLISAFQTNVESSARYIAEDLVNEVLRTGTVRKLRVVGKVGDVVPFSPHAHELAAEGGRSAAKVRIIRPLVERTTLAGHTEVLLRAVVEPAD